VNALDIMQNTSIIYHIESILEMQFMCLLTIYLMKPSIEGVTPNQTSNGIIFALILEHIFAYCSGVFRTWEIANYGKLDVNGVYRAKTESFLSTVEIFVDCIIFGYTISHLFGLSSQEF
jgi:hypothetical protein